MSEPISVRSVFRNELPRLLEMVHALAAFHGDQSTVTLDDLARDVLGNSPWYQVLVAVRGNRIRSTLPHRAIAVWPSRHGPASSLC